MHESIDHIPCASCAGFPRLLPPAGAQQRSYGGRRHGCTRLGHMALTVLRATGGMADRVPEEVKQRVGSQAVLGRTRSAQDIAEQVVTFCRAESVTGQVIVVDGGMPGGMR